MSHTPPSRSLAWMGVECPLCRSLVVQREFVDERTGVFEFDCPRCPYAVCVA